MHKYLLNKSHLKTYTHNNILDESLTKIFPGFPSLVVQNFIVKLLVLSNSVRREIQELFY